MISFGAFFHFKICLLLIRFLFIFVDLFFSSRFHFAQSYCFLLQIEKESDGNTKKTRHKDNVRTKVWELMQDQPKKNIVLRRRKWEITSKKVEINWFIFALFLFIFILFCFIDAVVAAFFFTLLIVYSFYKFLISFVFANAHTQTERIVHPNRQWMLSVLCQD